MELEKLSKAELIEKVQSLMQLVEQQRHLADAVNAKDKEIIDLTKAKSLLEKDLIELKSLRQSVVQAGATLESRTQELNKLRADYEAYKKTVPSLDVLENLKKDVKILEERNKSLIEFLNPYVANFRSVLKGIQGTLEVGIEYEALLSEKINKK